MNIRHAAFLFTTFRKSDCTHNVNAKSNRVFYRLHWFYQLHYTCTWLQSEAINIIELHNRHFCKEYMYNEFSCELQSNDWFLLIFLTNVRIWNISFVGNISFIIVNKEFIPCVHWKFVHRVLYSYFLILNDEINIQLP